MNYFNFISKHVEQLKQSDFYFEYSNKYNYRYDVNTSENITTADEKFLLCLFDLCEQMYKRTKPGTTITIFSYGIGYGFVEAFYSLWLLSNSKCTTVNLIFADDEMFTETIESYGIFTNVFSMDKLYSSNSTLEKILNGFPIPEDDMNFYIMYDVNLFVAFNPQNYYCSSNITPTRWINTSIISFLIILGIVKRMIPQRDNLLNTSVSRPMFEYLLWTRDIQMLWIFWSSQSVFETNITFPDTNDIEYQNTMIENGKFRTTNQALKSFSSLFNIMSFMNIYPLGNINGKLSFVHYTDVGEKLRSVLEKMGISKQTVLGGGAYYKSYIKYKCKYNALCKKLKDPDNW